MLSNPVTENAANADTAEMVKPNLSLYRQMVVQCVRKSLHQKATLSLLLLLFINKC